MMMRSFARPNEAKESLLHSVATPSCSSASPLPLRSSSFPRHPSEVVAPLQWLSSHIIIRPGIHGIRVKWFIIKKSLRRLGAGGGVIQINTGTVSVTLWLIASSRSPHAPGPLSSPTRPWTCDAQSMSAARCYRHSSVIVTLRCCVGRVSRRHGPLCHAESPIPPPLFSLSSVIVVASSAHHTAMQAKGSAFPGTLCFSSFQTFSMLIISCKA